MRLRRIETSEDAGADLVDETRGGAGAQGLFAELQVDDIEAAEGLDDVGLGGPIARTLVVGDKDAFGADAERQVLAGLLLLEHPEQHARQVETGAIERDTGLVVIAGDAGRSDVHHR